MKLPGQIAVRHLQTLESRSHVIIVISVKSANRKIGLRLTSVYGISDTLVAFEEVTFAEFMDTDNVWCTLK